MGKNWLVYLAGLSAAVVFYIFYFGWFSWFVLVLVVCLPSFSFLVSLPAMLRIRLRLDLPDRCLRNETVYLTLGASNGFLPLPRCRFRLRMYHRMTRQVQLMKQQVPGHDSWYIPVCISHCGVVEYTVEKAWVYDYLGLFRLPVRGGKTTYLMVEPEPRKPEKLPNLSQFLARQRRPKPGGGFSEEHELRDYRPGDSLRDMHWKLSVKTDRLIVREAQEPVREQNILTLDLRGTPDHVDDVLEQLLWLSGWLLEHQTEHQIIWIDPADCQLACVTVQETEDLRQVLQRMLGGTLREDTPSLVQRRFPRASWRYHIQPEQEVLP